MEKSSFFFEGYKAMIGWVIAFSLLWSAVCQPILSFVAVVFLHYKGEIPKAELTELITTLFKIMTSLL